MTPYRILSPLFIALMCSFLTISAAQAEEDLSAQGHLDDARSLYSAGHWDDAAQAFAKAYNLAPADGEIRAATALEWSSLLWEQGHYPRAESLVNEAIELARKLGRDDAAGQLLLTLGHIEASKGELSAAENTLNICVQLTGESGDRTFRALCRLNRRVVRTLRGSDPGPVAEFHQDINALRTTDAPLPVGTSLEKTAELYRDSDDLERAQLLLDEAQRLYQSMGNVPAMTRNRLRQVQLLHRRGEFAEAATRLPTLLGRFEEMGNRPLIIQVLALQAEQALHNQNLQQAFGLYQRAFAVAEAIDNPQLKGRVDLALCELPLADSVQYCRRAADTFQKADMRFLYIRALTRIAQAHQQRSNLEEARDSYRAALAMLETTTADSDTHALTRTIQLANLCQVESRLGATGALLTCQHALDGFSSIAAETLEQYQLLRAATTSAAAQAATAEGRGTTALNYFKESAALYLAEKEPDHLAAASALLNLGHLQARIEAHQNEAPATFKRALELIPLPSTVSAETSALRTTRISVLTQLAQLQLAGEAWQEASSTLNQLKDEALIISDLSNAAWAYSGIALTLLKSDSRDEAISALRQGLTLAQQAGNQELIQQLTENLQRLDALE